LSLRDRILREGPVRFDVAVEQLLYGDGGFFASGAGAGRRADFITSPEIGPLFGAVVARALDAEWTRLGSPDPFVVVEAAAGRGALVRAIVDAAPACLPALRYVCVERSAALRERISELVPVEPAANVFGAVVHGDDPDDDANVVTGTGPVVAVLDELPLVPITGVVLANELLDNLPFRLLERDPSGWREVFAGLDGEILVAASPDAAAEADRLAPAAPPGARVPLQHAGAEWVRRALALLHAGRLILVDYADSSSSLANRPWQEWLRTYRQHQRGGAPLDHPGEQDVTCEVAVDQLVTPTSNRSQAEWLRAHGIDELVEAARAGWKERAHVGDLEAVRHRSRVSEAEALLDPDGLGAFRVLEWAVS
jgi:SAM-dependent MidA family methyltransferase